MLIATNSTLMLALSGKQVGPWIYTAFNSYMEEQGIEPRTGAPPKGQMERTLEMLLKVLDTTADWGPIGEQEEDEDLD